jgi:hypothetical protein
VNRQRSESTFLPLKEALENEMSFSAGVFMSDDAKEASRPSRRSGRRNVTSRAGS